MKKSNKKKIIAAACLATTIGIATWISPSFFMKDDISNTNANTTNNAAFIMELEAIEDNYSVNFNNKELYQLLTEQYGELTTRKLREIRTLTIDHQMSNSDLSDLKYLINLESLTIKTNFLDLSDLKYNVRLNQLNLTYCTVTNTAHLPNSISRLDLFNVDISDNQLIIPYDTKELTVYESSFNGFIIKNKEALESFNFYGYNIFDLNDIKGCPNLNRIYLGHCPNITNGQALREYAKIERIELDDYAAIWLDYDTIHECRNIYDVIRNKLITEIRKLDRIAESLVPYDIPDEEKISKITRNVMSRIKYDTIVLEGGEAAEIMENQYNKLPISYALNDDKGICVNYACLFTALANRVGLDNYQQRSATHTWNMVRKENTDTYTGYDATELDEDVIILRDQDGTLVEERGKDTVYYLNNNGASLLYHYDFDVEEMDQRYYNGIVEKLDQIVTEYELGYINPKSQDREQQAANIRTNTFITSVLLADVLVLLDIISDRNKKNKKNKKQPAQRLRTRKIN